MFGKPPRVSPLALQKELLIAESDLNRAHLSEDWAALAHGVCDVADRAKTIAAWASSAALLVATVTSAGRSASAPGTPKPSWFQKLLNGARVASAIWLAFRSQAKRGERD